MRERKKFTDSFVTLIDDIQNLSKMDMLETLSKRLISTGEEIKELKFTREHNLIKEKLKHYHTIKSVIYFLETGLRMETLKPNKFQKFEWIANKLVLRGEMDKEILKQFENLDTHQE